MLNIFRRHLKTCRHRDKGRKHRHCGCPIWVTGVLNGKPIRKSLDLRSWELAQARIREMEATGAVEPESAAGPMEIAAATKQFLADAKARNLREPSLKKYRVLFAQLTAWARHEGYHTLRQLGVQQCREFRQTWKDAPISSVKKLERFKSFLRFCVDSGWIEANPAKDIKPPKVDAEPTLPLTHAEWLQLLTAASQHENKRLKAFVLLLRYSGLRITDAATLSDDRIINGRLLLYTQKTTTPVTVKLPPFVLLELDKLPKYGRYYFWTGEGKPATAAGLYRRTLRRLYRRVMKAAGHTDAWITQEIQAGHSWHPHRFRDTFAVSLLEKGTPIEDVSKLLGHKSIEITQKHYAPWVKSRQDALDRRVEAAWADDGEIVQQNQEDSKSAKVQ